MAVQMATSSAQDFLNFDLGNGANPSSGKTPGVPSFEEALASVVKTEQGKQPATHSAHVPGNGVTKRSAPNLAAIRAHLAMAVTGGEIATEEMETSPTLPQIAYELDRYLKSLAAQNCEAHPDVEFPDMQNLFTEWKLHLSVEKTARFNPDTILFPPEMICVEAEKVEEKMETEENAEMPLPSFFAPELSGEVLLQSTISGENVQSSEPSQFIIH